MEGGELRVASGRIGSSSVWRSGAVDVFSGSSRRDDDEQELQWAAIEKLPTYLRMTRGILNEAQGEQPVEIDINKLGPLQRKNLVERLVRISEEDNEKFLLKLRQRIDRVGLDFPTIEVRFEHLNVDAEARVGSRSLPTILNFSINLLEGCLNFLHLIPIQKKPLTVLQNVSGIVKPKRMTLLLGPPSSGKTTLLLALAGRLSKDLKLSGRVTYNDHGMEEFVPQRTSAYISQTDLHIGELTVRETLAFSARCQGIGTRYDMLAELSRREKAENIKPDPDLDIYMKAEALEGQETNIVTDYIIKILGLDVCADTMVGDDMIRGISGGQRKRVTTGEMLVGPARALFMDEISTGLDSSTTFQMINSLRQSIQILNGTALISLLQPTPETYELFDDIILLSDGQIVYQGPRENVLEFFEHVGFKCPERKGVADFLQEVTSRKDQEQYWKNKDEPYNFITVREFVEAFQLFHIGHQLGDELATPFDTSKGHPAVVTKNRYGVSKKELLKACVSRELLLMKRNSFVYIFKMWQLIFTGIVTMTMFLRTEMHRNTEADGGIYMGALFFILIVIMFNGYAELSMFIVKLPVFYKQRDLLFFPAWAYSLPTWILKIPISFVEVGIWVVLTYYVIGFDPSFERFIKQYFLLVCINQMASALFRFIGAVGRNVIIANTVGSFALIAVLVLGGFILSRVDVKKWWLWGYWLSPMMYGQNAIAVNEFLGKSWTHVPLDSTEPLGVKIMKSRGIFPEAYWYWIGVGVSLGYMLLFNILFPLALHYLDAFGKPQALISEEALAERNAATAGDKQIIEPSSKLESSSAKGNASQRSFSSTTLSAKVGTVSTDDHSRKRGMILPFTPLSITFDEIGYEVDMPQEMKAKGILEDRLELLKGVNGAFRPGVLTALMGISGAGKTTLMDVLSGRKTTGYIQGEITISGYPKKQETFARISGYCEQTDIHSPHVTIYESLVYSAWLRLPPEVDSATRKMFIEEVMELIELTSIRDALVGLPGVNGLSTEQRKRLTIAVELVANPSIIFMDEPTSGLDARAAAIVMRTVRNTVDTGRTVVCTIHQPSIDIFDAFDELLLLKRGGEEIYVGPLGRHCSQLINYFEGINGVPKIKNGYNPATWMLEVTSEAQEAALGVNFSELYKNSDLYRRNKDLIKELSSPPEGSKDLYFTTQHRIYSLPPEMKAKGILEDRLELLKGVNGAFRPGVLTALMGISGAGKTTLMDVLSGRKTTGYIQGEITISGYPKKQETFARISGYCEQTDIHSPHVTIYESLVYSAWLRLPPEVDSATRKMFIEEVMELIELTSIRDALVGLPGVNGLSTEQRKRLTIAVELVANPSIIFMDEPTSGLDARAAAIVMRTVRNTVDTGRTVVCTIHQPSIDIFDAFDELLLLKRGGEEIYVGPLGRHCSQLINYFEGINGVPKIKNGYNPATWMLEVTSEAQEAALGVNFSELYKNSDLYRRNKDLIKELSSPPEGSKDLYFTTQHSQSFFTQCMACLWKQHLSYWRNPPYSAVRLLFTTIIAILFGTIFWDIGSKRERRQDIFNAMGSMYAAVLFIGVQNATTVQPVVVIERTVFYREKAAGMYSALPYAFGQVAVEIPYVLIQSILYGVIVYIMIGFERTPAKFFWYLFFMFFTLLYFTLFGMMLAGATPDHNVAAIVSFGFYMIWNLFSGFVIPRTRMPIWWRWFFWICPIAWTLYGLVATQFGDVKDRLDTGETVEEFVMSYFGYRDDFKGVAAAVVVGLSLIFGSTFAFSIKTFNFQKR